MMKLINEINYSNFISPFEGKNYKNMNLENKKRFLDK